MQNQMQFPWYKDMEHFCQIDSYVQKYENSWRDKLTLGQILDGRRERDVFVLEEVPDQVAADGLGAVADVRRLQIGRSVRSRVHRRIGHAVAPHEDREQSSRRRGERACRDGPRCYFHFGKMAPDRTCESKKRARNCEENREKFERSGDICIFASVHARESSLSLFLFPSCVPSSLSLFFLCSSLLFFVYGFGPWIVAGGVIHRVGTR